jgi:endonuclease YncB( thermonuclease family)
MKQTKIVITAVLIFTLISGISFGSEYPDIEDVEFVRNYDGDTITVNIKGYPDLIGNKIPIRVRGVDTPEIRGSCEIEKEWAKMSKDFVNEELTKATKIDIISPDRGKYFRIVGDVIYDGKSLGKELLSGGDAVPYDGGTKVNEWCD